MHASPAHRGGRALRCTPRAALVASLVGSCALLCFAQLTMPACLPACLPARRFWVFYRFYNDFDHFVVSCLPAHPPTGGPTTRQQL